MEEATEKTEDYISLQEATKLCQYSQEYLSLRARQGKIKSIKFGRNWVTKKEWLDEYLSKIEDFNEEILKKKAKTVPPPVNLPVEVEDSIAGSELPELRMAVSLGVIFIVLLVLGFSYFYFLSSNVLILDNVVASVGNLSTIAAEQVSYIGEQAGNIIESGLDILSARLYQFLDLNI